MEINFTSSGSWGILENAELTLTLGLSRLWSATFGIGSNVLQF